MGFSVGSTDIQKPKTNDYQNGSVPGSEFKVQRLQVSETANYINQGPEYPISPIGSKGAISTSRLYPLDRRWLGIFQP